MFVELTLQRLWFTSRSVCGELVSGALHLYTLELPVKDGLPGSAILPGRYKVVLQPSPKFMASSDPYVMQYAQKMPHIICPPRSLIMFHWLNFPTETDGCVGTGLTHDVDEIGEARAAFTQLFKLIEAPALAGECWVNVQGGTPMAADRAERDVWP